MPDFFDSTRPGKIVTRGSATFELPILYFRDDVFALFYTADLKAVRALMPSPRLHPVAFPGGRAVIGVVAFNYLETSIGPYGEVGVVALTVHGAHPPLPVLPGLLEGRYPGFGNLVLHLPVTSLVARDAGRGEWGYTKFVADMEFLNTPEYHQCRMSERGEHILTMRVAKKGLAARDAKPLVTYSVNDGRLLKTVISNRGICRNALVPSGSHLSLGRHPVADSIGALGLSGGPFLSRYYVERSGILPAGEVVEEGVGPLEGYLGSDRDGKHVVEYLG